MGVHVAFIKLTLISKFVSGSSVDILTYCLGNFQGGLKSCRLPSYQQSVISEIAVWTWLVNRVESVEQHEIISMYDFVEIAVAEDLFNICSVFSCKFSSFCGIIVC